MILDNDDLMMVVVKVVWRSLYHTTGFIYWLPWLCGFSGHSQDFITSLERIYSLHIFIYTKHTKYWSQNIQEIPKNANNSFSIEN